MFVVASLLMSPSHPADLASQLQREEEEVQRLLQQLRCTLKAATLPNPVTSGKAGTDACGAGGVAGAEPGAEEAVAAEEAGRGQEDGDPETPAEEAEMSLQVSWSGQGLALDMVVV